MAESRSVKTDEESFSCPICLEQLRIPRYLPCLHTFCEMCIQTYISSTAARCEQNALNFIECPVCRKPAIEPRKGVSSEEWVKDLPIDKWILTMSVNSVNESNKYCLFCRRENITTLAQHWCKTCAEPICEDCNRFHRRVPVLQNHKIYCLSDSQKWCEPVDVEEQCSVHKGKLVEVFCRDHNKMCCSVCFATLHRTCSSVESIEDVALELDKESVKNKVKTLTDLLSSLVSLQEENMLQKERLNKAKEDICLNFEGKVKKAKAQIDEGHAQWLKRFDVVHTQQADNIDTVSDELRRFGTTVKEAKTFLSSVLENGSEKQLFITQHKLLTQISAHFERLKSLPTWDFAETYSEANTDIIQQICKTGHFEDVKISIEPSNALPLVSKCCDLITGGSDFLPRPKPWLATKDLMTTEFHKISVLSTLSWVSYGIFIDDERILISITDKPSLQVYDVSSPNGKVVHILQCKSDPFGICYAKGMDKVYVAFKTVIVQYQIENRGLKFTEITNLYVYPEIEGLAVNKNMVFTVNQNELAIRSCDFKVKLTVSHCVKNGKFVCASFSTDKLAFATENHIIVKDLESNTILDFKDSVTTARGLAFDSKENIFVCKHEQKPMQIRYDGKSSRQIDLSIDGQHPYNIVFHPAGHRFMCLYRFEKKVAIFDIKE